MARSAQGDAFLDVTMRLRKGFQQTVSKAAAGECYLVCYLREHEGRASPGKLAAASGRSTARIAAALNSLEAKGLVTRQTCGEDRRKVQVLLTPAGEPGPTACWKSSTPERGRSWSTWGRRTPES